MAKRTFGGSLLEGVIGLAAGYIIGELANAEYKSLSGEQKRQWERDRVAHHGEVGCVALAVGVGGKSPLAAGVGLGLMVSDRKDSGKWFSK